MLVDLPRPMSRAWGAGKFFSVVRYADCVQISSISDEDFEKSMHVTELKRVYSCSVSNCFDMQLSGIEGGTVAHSVRDNHEDASSVDAHRVAHACSYESLCCP